MLKNTLLFSTAILFYANAFCQATGKIQLAKGQKYQIESKVSVASTQEVMGQSMDSKADFVTMNNVEVKDITEGNYNLVNTFTKITGNIDAMGQNMNFDSDNKEDLDGDMGSGMKDLVNQPKDVVVDKNGKIVPGVKDTSAKGGGGMMSMMMKQVMGAPEETGYGLSEAFMVVPAKATAGYTWGDSSTANGIKRATIYTIKEIKGSDATVSVSGVMDVDTKMEAQGTEVATKSTGKITGEQIVDLKTGLIKQRNTSVQSSGKLNAGGMEIPTTANITYTSSVKSN